MKIGKKMNDAFNDQIQAEFQSAYLYLGMAAWFEDRDLPGFAHWMRKQYNEEVEHAMKMFDYVAGRGGRAELKTVDAPQKEWKSPQDAFRQTYDHEQSVTARIYKLVDDALAERDYASVEFLNWFVKEQVEEEDTAAGILAKLDMMGDCEAMLLLPLDAQLGAR